MLNLVCGSHHLRVGVSRCPATNAVLGSDDFDAYSPYPHTYPLMTFLAHCFD